MHSDIGKMLSKYGFDKKESALYVSLLTIGRVQVSELARSVGLPRTSIYLPLESLEKQGLAYKVKIGSRYFWEATSPKSIVRNMKENISGLESILPDLENLTSSQKKAPSDFLFYKNKEGVSHANEMILSLRSDERIYAVQGSGTIKHQKRKFSEKEMADWQTRFRKSGVISEIIIGDDFLETIKDLGTDTLKAHLGRKTIVYILPKHMLNFDAQIYAFRTTIIVMSFQKDLTVIINNADIASVFVNLIKIASSFGRKIDFNSKIASTIASLKS